MRVYAGTITNSTNVIAFPTRAQASERLRSREIAAGKVSSHAKPVVYDGAWYHEEAIEQERAERAHSSRIDY